MIPSDFRLLIHHHHPAHQDGSGKIWLTSVIGRWVSALAIYFKEIGLLLHETAELNPQQDTVLNGANIVLYSLGPPGRYWDRLPRMARIRRTCKRAGVRADGLLVRGLTPRQHTVWQSTPVDRKAFLLVNNPQPSKIRKWNATQVIMAAIIKHREQEFKKMAQGEGLIMANSLTHLGIIEEQTGKRPIFVPTNTIRKNEFAALRPREVSQPLRLLYVGRLDILKGLRELLSAVALLLDLGYECFLDLVALRKEPVYSELQTLARELAVADRICWHGYVPYGSSLFERYQTADFFVLPTYTEGFPHVIWEAAANCCPVITTAVGGIPALIKDEIHALLIPPRDIQAIGNAIIRLINDKPLRHHLVKHAYQQAAKFSVEECARILATSLTEAWS